MHINQLIPHIEEMRTRLIRCCFVFVLTFLICYFFSGKLFQFIALPLVKVWGDHHKFIYTGVTEAFMTHINLSAFGAFFITIPYMLIQAWGFIAPGLYTDEKKLFRLFLFLTPILFFLGACFSCCWVMPKAYQFFLSFEMSKGLVPIQAEFRLEEYLSFVMHLVLAFGFCFQIPVLMMVLVVSNLLSLQTLKQKWRQALAIISIVCAIITPPDLFSMLFLLVPLFGLYIVSLAGVSLMERYRKKTSHVGYSLDSLES